jgi:anti-sigma factor RsiW
MKNECAELAERLSAFLDGEAPEADVAGLLQHLEKCHYCRSCLETLRATRALLQKMPSPEIPPEMKARLKACLKAEKA